MADESYILKHLRAGHDQRARIDEAVAAFRRLAPGDYGYFLATIEGDLGGPIPELAAGKPPLLLTEGDVDASARRQGGSGLREAIVALLADGQARSTADIRRTLEASRPVNRASLHTEIFTLRKTGILRSEGRGRGSRHTLVSGAAPRAAGGGNREPSPRATRRKRKRDADEDRPARAGKQLDAERLYAAAIDDHYLLSPGEELELARRLEKTEVALWERLLGGPLGAEARQLLRRLEEPVDPVGPTGPGAARAADPDRQIVSEVIGAERPADDRLAAEVAVLRSIVAEADRIRDRFVTCNLRLVPAVIRRYGYHLGTPLSMGDLIQEGNCGLIRAVPRFDHRRGLRFSTFATWWIRHYVVRARQNLDSDVRVPVHLQELASKVRRTKAALQQTLGREPTTGEIAAAAEVSRRSLQTLESAWLRHRETLPSFDSTGEEGEAPSHLASGDPLADEVLARHQEDGRLAAAVARLPPTLAQVVRRRFGLDGAEPEILLQIGESMQLSRERIRQLEKRALALLRRSLAETEDLAA